jgi:hypothetical protein
MASAAAIIAGPAINVRTERLRVCTASTRVQANLLSDDRAFRGPCSTAGHRDLAHKGRHPPTVIGPPVCLAAATLIAVCVDS